MNNAPLVQSIMSPYRKRFIHQVTRQAELFPGVFPDDPSTKWIVVDQYLTDTKINHAIYGKAVYGVFLAYCTRSFGIDIDDHQGKGWAYLVSVYNTVCTRLQARPSLLVRTPHGLHLWYFLDHPVPEILLIARVREAVRGVPVEVKPTADVGLRLPVERNLLDPETLHPVQIPFGEVIKAAPTHHPIELFYDGLSPKLFVESLKDRKAKVIANKTWEKVCRVEAEYAGIQPGTTNEAMCELIPVYRSAGCTPEEAMAEFTALLAPHYTGELRDERRLLQRIRSFYKQIPETRFTTIPHDIPEELFTNLIVEAIVALYVGPAETNYQRAAVTKKKQTIRKAVVEIERWRLYIDSVKGNRRFLEMWNYIYPYFTKNTGEGYYPLSRNILKKVHTDYSRWLLPFLVEIGYLKRSPYRYSSVYGICYYYEIQSDDFIARQPKRELVVKPKNKAELRAEAIRAYKRNHPDMSNRAIAEVFGVSHFTINEVLRKR